MKDIDNIEDMDDMEETTVRDLYLFLSFSSSLSLSCPCLYVWKRKRNTFFMLEETLRREKDVNHYCASYRIIEKHKISKKCKRIADRSPIKFFLRNLIIYIFNLSEEGEQCPLSYDLKHNILSAPLTHLQ